jgi:hypothetical protein
MVFGVQRRGTKNNPFKVGENVRVFPMNSIGEVKRVIYPGRPRGWIKYEVEVPFLGEQVVQEFSALNLEALEDGAAG